VIEIDGYQWHSTKSAFERDHSKDATLRAHGLDVGRFTADQIANQPYMAVAAVARRLSERSGAALIASRDAVWEFAPRPSTPIPDGPEGAGR
jgi:very-short-patch-repair endonuclease